MPDDFSVGFFLGVLVGEGHFGGDGRQPQITLRMDVRHEGLFRWLVNTFPGGKLYGPYHHGERHYYQWMIRGQYLKNEIAPLIAQHIDYMYTYVKDRFMGMCERYKIAVVAEQKTES